MERGPGDSPVSANRPPVPSHLHGGVGQHEAPVRRIEYVRPAEVTTLGVDPLVSSASVIHELAFGRTAVGLTDFMGGKGYPVSKEEARHTLDFFV